MLRLVSAHSPETKHILVAPPPIGTDAGPLLLRPLKVPLSALGFFRKQQLELHRYGRLIIRFAKEHGLQHADLWTAFAEKAISEASHAPWRTVQDRLRFTASPYQVESRPGAPIPSLPKDDENPSPALLDLMLIRMAGTKNVVKWTEDGMHLTRRGYEISSRSTPLRSILIFQTPPINLHRSDSNIPEAKGNVSRRLYQGSAASRGA